jgi:hypothetical protein
MYFIRITQIIILTMTTPHILARITTMIQTIPIRMINGRVLGTIAQITLVKDGQAPNTITSNPTINKVAHPMIGAVPNTITSRLTTNGQAHQTIGPAHTGTIPIPPHLGLHPMKLVGRVITITTLEAPIMIIRATITIIITKGTTTLRTMLDTPSMITMLEASKSIRRPCRMVMFSPIRDPLMSPYAKEGIR